MTKEEILERSRKENRYSDERDKIILAQSTTYGAIGMAIMFVILFSIRLFIKGEQAYDLFAMYFSFLAVSSLYQYKLLKSKGKLKSAIIYLLITITWLVLYMRKG